MKFKKWLSMLLAVFMMLANLGNVAYAASSEPTNESSLLSYVSTSEMDNYANQIFVKHLSAAIHSGSLENFGLSSNSIADYNLGTSFSVTDIDTQQNTYFYPVLCNGNVDGLLQVMYSNNEYSSSLGDSFSDELMGLMMRTNGYTYQLYSDGNNLYAHNGTTVYEIYQIYNDGNTAANLEIPTSYRMSQIKEITVQDLTTSNVARSSGASTFASSPSSYKTIDVTGVSQGSHPWCWAATCAALINYYEGESLTASDVANYVFPDDPEQGGVWTDMQSAYNHWGLYPTQTGRISFSSVKSNINDYLPMHLGLTGHSVGLIGYEDWGLFGDNILIILDPNGGVRKTVTLKSNGNFDYYLSGTNSWNYTREF